jgi:DNA-directed RNA polymerase beta subunit
VYNLFKRARRAGVISEQISISRDPERREIRILTDSGRCCRPLLIVRNNIILLKKEHLTQKTSIQDLVKQGLIEYLDVEEE